MAITPMIIKDLTIGTDPATAYTFPSADGANTEVLTTDGAGNLSFAAGGGTMSSFSVDGDTGAPQTISDGDTLLIVNAAGGAMKTVAVAPDTVTLDLSVTGVVAGSYTSTDLTVDSQGRITAASSGGGGAGFIPFLPNGTITALNNLTLGWEFMGSEHTLHSQASTFAWFQPFYAPFTGSYGTIKAGGSSGDSNLRLAFYSVDANDMPDSVIGSVSTDFTGAANTVITNGGNWYNVNTAVAASAPSLVRGTKYYIGITTNGAVGLAARDGVGPSFLNDTYSYWYSAAAEDPSCNLMYLNADSGAAAGDLPTSITVADLTNFAGNYETALFAVDKTPKIRR